MLFQVYSDPQRVRHLASDPLGRHVDAFVNASRDQGFARLTIHAHLRVFGKFNRWLKHHDISADQLAENHIESFISSRRRREHPKRNGRDVLVRLLAHLREGGVVPLKPKSPPSDAIEQILQDFGSYLSNERGASAWTILRYGPLIRTFLRNRFGSRPICFGQLRAKDIHFAIVSAARDRRRTYARGLVSALRAFLRWLQFCGKIAGNLAAAVPTVADWHLRGVPVVLRPSEVVRVLRTCDRRTAMGRRDYAALPVLTGALSVRFCPLDDSARFRRSRRKSAG